MNKEITGDNLLKAQSGANLAHKKVCDICEALYSSDPEEQEKGIEQLQRLSDEVKKIVEDVLANDLAKIRKALKDLDKVTEYSIDADELCNHWSRLPKPIQEILVTVSEDTSLGVKNKVFLMNLSRDIGCLHLGLTGKKIIEFVLKIIDKGRRCEPKLKLEKYVREANEIMKNYKEGERSSLTEEK